MRNITKIVSITIISLLIMISGCSSHKTKVKPISVDVNTTTPVDIVDTNESDHEILDLNISRRAQIYMPVIDIDPQHTIYVSNTKELQKAIDDAKEGDTVMVKAGSYGGIYIENKKHLTIKSLELHKASFSEVDPEYIHGKSAFKLVNSSYINILGFEAKDSDYFVFVPSWKASVHHIYIADCLIHNQKASIYSGRSSYAWTVDRCEIYDITKSPAWTALGYHHTLQNSKLYKIHNFYISIRGHAPIGEVNQAKYPRYDKLPLRDREASSYQKLSTEDWTHMVINNTFGQSANLCGSDCEDKKCDKNRAVGFYIGGKDSGISEQHLLAPQNVEIKNNTFYNTIVYMDKEFGFSKNPETEAYPILGTKVIDNISTKEKLVSLSNSMVEIKNNTIMTNILKKK